MIMPTPSGYGARLGHPRRTMLAWLSAFAICLVATAASYFFLDVAFARFIHELPFETALRSPMWSTPLLISVFGAAFFVVAVRAMLGLGVGYWGQTIVLIALSVALAACLNEMVLKPLFDRPMPHNFFATGHHTFGLMRDRNRSSFPSGHAAQIVAVLTVIWNRHRTLRALWALLLAVPLGLLVLGNWHFLSDLIAGGFLGAFCAASVMALWNARTAANSEGRLGGEAMQPGRVSRS